MATLANAHFVDCDITESTSGSDSWSSTTQERTTAFPQTRHHLEGETVDILDDGVVATDQAITHGAVTGIAGTYHIGLNYTSTLKPSKLDFELLGLVIIKNLTKIIVSFYETLEGEIGTETDEMETIAFGTSLFTGIKEVPVLGGYEREGTIILTQDEPLPLTTRGMVVNFGVVNKV